MSILNEPRLIGVTVGSADFFRVQNQLISERPLLKYCYENWYQRLLADYNSTNDLNGIALELGSGGSQLKKFIPSLITSDIVAGFADQVVDAQSLPFSNETIKSIFLTHAFHHIPDVRKFLTEASRCLKPNGVISMIEVAHTPFSKFFFHNFHPEPYLPQLANWSFTQSDAMMDANQALSWMVFIRDAEIFKQEFPQLNIEIIEHLPWLSYLVSGGVTKRNIVPKFLSTIILGLEKLLTPIRPLCALHWHIRIRKTL
jgi:SAM-dependent methyltransferase